MEMLEGNGSTAPLPDGLPEEVQLLDHRWLSEQEADGAQLALLDPSDLKRLTAAAGTLRAELDHAVAERDNARSELAALERLSSTERSANKALLAAVVDLDARLCAVERDDARSELAALARRFSTERSANKALLAAVVDLDARRRAAETRAVFLDGQVLPLKAEINQLRRALCQAQRPLWRKLLRRGA